MLGTLDTLIAFAVIMTVLSLLITTLVQMVSAALSLRGKNLANALSLTLQSIDPQIGKQAYRLADHILNDPVLSDSLFRPKDRPPVDAPTLLRAVATQAAKAEAQAKELVAIVQTAAQNAPGNPLQQVAVAHADQALQTATDAAQAATQSADEAHEKIVAVTKAATPMPPARQAPWRFFYWKNIFPWRWFLPSTARHLSTAVRPDEVYRLLHGLSVLSDDEAQQRQIAGLNTTAANLLKALGVPDEPAQEASAKLASVVQIASLFTTAEEKKAVLDSLATFGTTLEVATAGAYDHFQRWFGSAQDRAEQWFQAHTRNVTVVCAVLLAFGLQVDTVEVFHQLHDSPGLVQSLVKSGAAVVETGSSAVDTGHQNVSARLTYLHWRQRHPLYALSAPLPEGSSFGDYQEAIKQRLNAAPDPAFALGEYADAYAHAKAAPSGADKPASGGEKVGLAYQAYLVWAAEFPAFALPPDDLAKLDRTQDDPAAVQAALTQQLQRIGNQESQDKSKQTTFVDDYRRAAVEIQQENLNLLKNALDQTGFELVPGSFLHRWQNESWGNGKLSWWKHFLPHGVGMLITTALLALGAPFWFNLLKNLMSLRPAVASLIERRPRSAPALPQTPPTPPPPS